MYTIKGDGGGGGGGGGSVGTKLHVQVLRAPQ